jgi:DNA repair protein RadC
MRIKSLPESERPLEKAREHGIKSLSSAELLAILIHTGTSRDSSLGLAEKVLGLCTNGVSSLGSLDSSDITGIDGIGESKAFVILAAAELGKRMASYKGLESPVADSSEHVAEMFMEELRYEKKEFFMSVLTNTKGEVIYVDRVSVGELTSAIVHPREVFSTAVKKSAACMIFLHNHPSGDPTPSEADIETTHRLEKCGEMLGINVLDHIIIGDGRFTSLRAEGLMTCGPGDSVRMN